MARTEDITRRSTSEERVDIWNALLLDELLPETEPGTPVVLACDEETIRVAGAHLGLPPDAAVVRFCRDVKTAFSVGKIAGFKEATDHDFDRAARPRPVPRTFALLCLWVLAASRMAPDESHATHAYHWQLRELLELPGTGALPNFEFIKPCFERLASWLREDLAGTHGHLLVPADPHPAWVGYAIAQTVFRQRDRQVLSLFFSRRLRGGLDGLDPLPLLRRWSGRHELTRHALEVIDDETVVSRAQPLIACSSGMRFEGRSAALGKS